MMDVLLWKNKKERERIEYIGARRDLVAGRAIVDIGPFEEAV